MSEPVIVQIVDQWGIAEWIASVSAVVTLAAVSISLWQALVARKEARAASDRSVKAEDRATRAELREEARAQAELERTEKEAYLSEIRERERFASAVYFAPTVLADFDDGEREHVRVAVRNTGPEPIFDVMVINSDDEDDQHRSPILAVIDGRSREDIQTLLKRSDYRTPEGMPRRSKPLLYFTDVSGRRWQKSWSGVLQQTAPEAELRDRAEEQRSRWWWRYGVDPERD